MKFSVIIPTYQRSKLLDRAINSLQRQSFQDWELIIINDSPDDKSYGDLIEHYKKDARIRYFINAQNQGVNYSRNRGLDLMSTDSTHVVFLDDDDYFSLNALTLMAESLNTKPEVYWLVTNRAGAAGQSYTTAPTSGHFYNYARDYLIGRQIKGDATHCIKIDKIMELRFPTDIRQAEEWLFYLELGRKCPLYYQNHNTTYTDGYLSTGLNDRRRQFFTETKVMANILKEAQRRHFFTYPYFYVYYLMRIIRLAVRF